MLSYSVMSNSLQPHGEQRRTSPLLLSGSSIHGIFQARMLEQVAISYSRGSSRPRDRTCVSCVSCTGRQILYHPSHQGSPIYVFVYVRMYVCVLYVCVLCAQSCPTVYDPWVQANSVTHQALLSMEFSKQEYWSRLPFPTPGDLPNPSIEPLCLESPAFAGGFFTTVPPGKPKI